MGQETQGRVIPPERLREIARNKLESLQVQTYVAQHMLLGRMRIDPTRLEPFEEVAHEPFQNVVVQGHDVLWFAKPSVLRFLGGLAFFSMRSQVELLDSVESRWRELVAHTRVALRRARAYFPTASLDKETWSIRASHRDNFGPIEFRVFFQGKDVGIEVVAVDGKPRVVGEQTPRLTLELPADPKMFDAYSLRPILEKVRAGETLADGDGPSDDFIDLGRFDVEPPAPGLPPKPRVDEGARISMDLGGSAKSVELERDDDASLDLDGLLTGDLAEPAANLEPPLLDPEHLEAIPAGEASRPLVRERLVRLSVGGLPATLRFPDGRTQTVRVANANYGGVFVDVTSVEAPKIGEVVELSGFGPLTVGARVVHNRPDNEARLFGTGEGVGMAFLDDASSPRGLRAAQDGPGVIVVVDDRLLLARTIETLVECGYPFLVANNLITAGAMFRYLDVRAVIFGETWRGHAFRDLVDALNLGKLGIRGILIADRSPSDLPSFIRVVGKTALDASTLRQMF